MLLLFLVCFTAACSPGKSEGINSGADSSQAVLPEEEAVDGLGQDDGEEISAPVSDLAEDLLMDAAADDEELAAALAMDIVPETLTETTQDVCGKEMYEMLSRVIGSLDPEKTKTWEDIGRNLAAADTSLQRDDAMLALYEAACVLEIGNRARDGWLNANSFYEAESLWDGFEPDGSLFANTMEASPYEDNIGHMAGWDYAGSAGFFSLGQSSARSGKPFFTYRNDEMRFESAVCCSEAVRACVRLIYAWQEQYEGGYELPETDWNDPLLQEASAVYDAVLSSSSALVRGDTLTVGETYTGSAYYVSPEGNDENDGLSPETAWATLDKVQSADLQYGDAILFECGGAWYGRLKLRDGVAYSSYGEGEKPILTGSPLDAGEPSNWVLFAEGDNGVKIWRYAEDMPDCGIILFDGGRKTARKLYLPWEGEAYTNDAGEAFDPVRDLTGNLEFFSAVDYSGYSFPINVWQMTEEGVGGGLYLRCDAGNPGDVFDSVEIAVLSDGIQGGSEGCNTLDHLNIRCYSNSGVGPGNDSVIQNCEISWCGGAVKRYENYDGSIHYSSSGGALLLFGVGQTARNNYIHDCESKGIAVVINGRREGGDGQDQIRKDILAEHNVVQRCGGSIYLWTGFLDEAIGWTYEDIVFRENYLIDCGHGWCRNNDISQGSRTSVASALNVAGLFPTGEVLLENNLFYRSAGFLINYYGRDAAEQDNFPIMKGNCYVQDEEGALLRLSDEVHGDLVPGNFLAVQDEDLMESCMREYIGDKEGTIFILSEE